MIIAAALAVLSILLGVGAGHFGLPSAILRALRAFAIAAVLVTILVHMLPEAWQAIGPMALVAFAAGLAAPRLLQGPLIARLHTSHETLVRQVSLIVLLIHQFGDGIAIGLFSADGSWAQALPIAIHSVPLLALFFISGENARPLKVLAREVILLIVATLFGAAISRWATVAFAPLIPWLDALIGGLILHMLTHDRSHHQHEGHTHAVALGLSRSEIIAVAVGVAFALVLALASHV